MANSAGLDSAADGLTRAFDARPPLKRPKTLAGVVGAAAAALLLTLTPAEESGRKVDVTIAADGSAAVRHVTGRQYRQVYLDIVRVPTACDGLTGKQIRPGMTFTEAQCATMLEAALVDHASHVMACTPGLQRAGTDHQRVAAVLLAYNIGWPRFCRSTVRARFNAGRYAAACDGFLVWNRAGGREVRGLTLRRQRERKICLTNLPN